MVKKIIQIADLHIPNSEKDKPYNEMLKKCISDILLSVKDYKKDEVRIVVCGDIFHNKIKISNEALQTFHTLLNFLNSIAKTIIFAGNHDMLENNFDRRDSITPTFEIKGAYKNITYIDKALGYKSGYVIDDNIIWVLYSMFDHFAKPSMDNLKEKYPASQIIGLYHGECVGAVNDMGHMSENGIDTKGFIGCDCVMAGHIHKFQEIRKEGVPIVYGGSLFQCNAGENITGHGFVEWDVDKLTYQLHEVENTHRILKFTLDDYTDVAEDRECLINL